MEIPGEPPTVISDSCVIWGKIHDNTDHQYWNKT